MKKYIFLFTTAIALLSLGVFAQPGIKVHAGTAISNWRGNSIAVLNNISDLTKGFVNQRPLTGYYLGFGVELPTGEVITIEPSLQYSRTGTSLKGSIDEGFIDLLGIGASADVLQQSIEVPVMIKAKILPGLSVMAGPQAAYLFDNDLRLRASVLGVNLLNQKIGIHDMFEPLQFSASGGITYELPAGLGIQAMYNHGFSRLTKNGSTNLYGQSVRIGLSYAF